MPNSQSSRSDRSSELGHWLVALHKIRSLANQQVGFLVQSSRHVPTCELLSAWIAPVGFGPNQLCDKARLLGQNIQNRARLGIT